MMPNKYLRSYSACRTKEEREQVRKARSEAGKIGGAITARRRGGKAGKTTLSLMPETKRRLGNVKRYFKINGTWDDVLLELLNKQGF